MPRPLRNYPSGTCLHLTQRGHNGCTVFHDDEERHGFLDLLKEHSVKANCDIHAYVLMGNHFHLLVSIREPNSQALLMKSIAQRTTLWRHARHGGSGSLWDK